MSYSMWSIDGICFLVNENYVNALKNEIIEALITGELTEELERKMDLFPEDWQNEDIKTIIGTYSYNKELYFYSYEENYSFFAALKEDGKINSFKPFEGFVKKLFSGSNCIFKPDYTNKEELIEEIKREFYIPEGYDVFENGNVVYLTGVCRG